VELPGCWVLLQCGIDPRTSGRMDCDVINVNSMPDDSAKESSYNTWKSLISVACLVFPFSLLCRASVTATPHRCYLYR